MNTPDNILLNKMRRDEQRSELENNLSMLAHDIQSPIGQVKGLLEIALKMSQNNPDLEAILLRALQSNSRLQTKVEDILNVSIDSGNQMQEVDFNAMFENVKEALNGIDGYEVTKFIIRIEEGLKFYGNPVHLQSIFQNLIENSIKYRKTGADRNIVVLSIDSGDEGSLIIKVTDNGRGIKKELLPYIFDKNFKAKESDNGHGMGLHFVKKNLNAIGANLEVESTEGDGTTFTITLSDCQAISKRDAKHQIASGQ